MVKRCNMFRRKTSKALQSFNKHDRINIIRVISHINDFFKTTIIKFFIVKNQRKIIIKFQLNFTRIFVQADRQRETQMSTMNTIFLFDRLRNRAINKVNHDIWHS